MVKKQMRLKEITQILATQVGASIKMLAAQLNVSEITVRRDVNMLVEAGEVRLINGVVLLAPETTQPPDEQYDIVRARGTYSRQKSAIGRVAAQMVNSGEVIAVDVGTTAEAMLAHMPPEASLTVVTAGVEPVVCFRDQPNYQIICAGGYLRNSTQMFQSPEGLSLIARTSINKSFMTASGINAKLHVTCNDPYEVQVKRTIIEASLCNILLVDSSKFNIICPGNFAHLSDFDTIITDSGLAPEWRETIGKLEIKLIIADA